jgi:hypothetical protein
MKVTCFSEASVDLHTESYPRTKYSSYSGFIQNQMTPCLKALMLAFPMFSCDNLMNTRSYVVFCYLSCGKILSESVARDSRLFE